MMGIILVIVVINISIGFSMGLYRGAMEAILEYKTNELKRK